MGWFTRGKDQHLYNLQVDVVWPAKRRLEVKKSLCYIPFSHSFVLG
jgi:hypothetical protein